MYCSSRIDSTRLRSVLANDTMLRNPSTITSSTRLWPRTLITAIAMSTPGIARIVSNTRMAASSTSPPRNDANSPIGIPWLPR